MLPHVSQKIFDSYNVVDSGVACVPLNTHQIYVLLVAWYISSSFLWIGRRYMMSIHSVACGWEADHIILQCLYLHITPIYFIS
jgi:hypothetical protein